MTEETTKTEEPKTEAKTAESPSAQTVNSGGKSGEKKAEEHVPLGTFKDLERKYRADAKRLEAFEAKEQEATDAKAKSEGNVAEAQSERDRYKAELDKYRASAQTELDKLTESLDEDSKAIMEGLGEDVPLPVRLTTARGLAGRKKPEPGVGSKGGASEGAKAGLIPQSITDRAAYYAWISNMSLSQDAAERALLSNPDKFAEVKAEARARELL